MTLKQHEDIDIWVLQGLFALSAAFLGALDPGSSNNVFIPLGVWIILLGTIGLSSMNTLTEIGRKYHLGNLFLAMSFAFLLYNPMNVIVPRTAKGSYEEYLSTLRSLDGPVYAPWQGYLGEDFPFYPAASWIAVEDLIRGPGKETSNHPNTRRLLDPVISPDSSHAYIFSNFPLDYYPWLEFLDDYYVLEEDFGDAFKSLRTLPARWDHGWPRYLYRYSE